MVNETEKSLSPAHGGEIEKVAREHNLTARDLIDFSANINPASPPKRVLERLARDAADIALLGRYPDLNFHELRSVIASHYKIPENIIVIANGSAALIDAALRAVAPQKCLLPVPAFSEYERALSAAHCVKINFPLSAEKNFALEPEKFIDQLHRRQPEFCIINNPHNPSGALIPRINLEKIVKAAAQTRTIVLLDEAFIDYAPEESLLSIISNFDNLIVLRSVTKFYSIPALRVGYAAASLSLAEKMSAQISSWSVTTLAANAASEIYRDEEFPQKTRRQNATEKEWLKVNLETLGVEIYPSAANFLLLELKLSKIHFAEFLRRLIVEHKIIVRDCSTYENLEKNCFIRVAVLSREQNKRLVSALAEYL